MSDFKQRLDELVKLRDEYDAEVVPSYAMPNGSDIGEMYSYANLFKQAITLAEELHSEVERLQKEVDEQCRVNGAGGERELALMAQNEQLRTAADKMKEALEHLVGSKTVDDQGRERYMMDVSPLMRTTTHNLYHAHRTAVEALSTYEQARGEYE